MATPPTPPTLAVSRATTPWRPVRLDIVGVAQAAALLAIDRLVVADVSRLGRTVAST